MFKNSKEYLYLLPLSKWSDLTVRGKLIGKTQSLMCTREKDGMLIVEVTDKQVKVFYKKLKVKVPSSASLDRFKAETLNLSYGS